MTDEVPDEVVDHVKASDLKRAMVKELSEHDPVRSGKLIESVKDHTPTTPETTMQTLQSLRDANIVKAADNNGEVELYSLTDFGEEVTSRIDLNDLPTESTPKGKLTGTERSSEVVNLDVSDVPIEKASERHGEWGARRPSWQSDEDDEEVEIRAERNMKSERSGEPTVVSGLSLVVNKEEASDRIEALSDELETLLVNSNVSVSELESAVKRVLDKHGGNRDE